MCGIVGVVGRGEAAPLLLEALRRLEYRGYDSAGIATLVNGHIERRRAEGKLGNLAAVLERAPLAGTTGIGHTRWATHGAPTERNAHPHSTAPRQRGAQRHHREPRRAARRAGGRGRRVRDRDRHRDLRPPGGPATWRRGMAPAEAFARRAEARARRLRAGRGLRRPSAHCCWRRGRARRSRSASARARCSSAPTRWRWPR